MSKLISVAIALMGIWNCAPAQPGTWSSKAPMPAERSSAAIASLNDIVYVIGGYDGTHAYPPTNFAYNVISNTWVTFGSPPGARVGNGAAIIDGELYTLGGLAPVTYGSSTNLYVYNPTNNTWRQRRALPPGALAGGVGVINRKLYVITPWNDTAYSHSFYRYDPDTDTWASLPTIPHIHGSPAIGVIDGRLYVAGGTDSTTYATNILDVYDPVSNAWTTKSPMRKTRAACAGAVLNGKFYVIGGVDDERYYKSVEVYQPATDSWTEEAPLPAPRAGLAAATVAGTIFVAGGRETTGAHLTTFEAFNSSIWRLKPPLPTPGASLTTVEIGGLIYAMGLRSNNTPTLDVYNTRTATWMPRNPMSVPRVGMAAGVIHGTIFVAGGYPSTRALEIYTPWMDRWTRGPDIPIPTEDRGTVLRGKLYVIGAKESGLCGTAVQIYEPGGKGWSFGRPMPTPRCHHAVATDNKRIYVMGGTTTSGAVLTDVEIYDPETDTWTSGAPMPRGRSHFGADAVQGRIYVVGGGITEVDVYDPTLDRWGFAPPTIHSRSYAEARAANDVLYAIGGVDSAGVPIAAFEALIPAHLNLRMYAGLEITGAVGSRYWIEYREDFEYKRYWITLQHLTLPSTPYFFIDPESATPPGRVYRALPAD